MRDPRARRLKLSVDERGARLTLPPRASLVSGDRFLQQHRDWLMPAHYEEASNSLKLSVHSWLLTIGGKRIGVVTIGDLIEPNVPIEVTAVEGNRIVVRRVP
mgnify:CR=1 FL=1